MKMRSGGIAGRTYGSYDIAGFYLVPFFYKKVGAMGVNSMNTVAVVKDDISSVTGIAVFGLYNSAVRNGKNVAAFAFCGSIICVSAEFKVWEQTAWYLWICPVNRLLCAIC